MSKGLSIAFKAAFYLYLAAIAVLCFGNFHGLPSVSSSLLGIPTDKVVHFCMFFPFPILAFLAYDKLTDTKKSVMIFALVTFAAGCLIAAGTELGQAYLTEYRSGDPADFLADFLAILLSTLIAAWMDLRKISS